MAYFAGSGPAGETCDTCKSFGFWRRVQDLNSDKMYRYKGCLRFKQLTGRFGPPIKGEHSACKYWTKKEDNRR